MIAQQASNRGAQYALEKGRPLQLPLAHAARILVPVIFCSTPEALHHLIHAPPKVMTPARGARATTRNPCTTCANRPSLRCFRGKTPRVLSLLACQAAFTRQA